MPLRTFRYGLKGSDRVPLGRRRRSVDGLEIVIRSSAEPLYVCLWTASIMFLRAALLAQDTRGIVAT